MKVEKFKVLLYLKKSEPDKTGKAPIMGRITLNRTMAQFSCKLSCTPGLWNARESRLNGKSREAVETNEKIERLLLAVHSAFNSLMERKKDFDAAAVRDMFQGNAGMQMTLLKLLDRHNEEMKARVGVDRAPTTMSTYVYTRRTLAEFIKTEFKVSDLAFGQLNEQFIRDYQDFCLEKKRLAMETVRHYLSILKKSEPDKTGKAPIMGRITLNRTMVQFSCKLSCTPGLWNARESRLNGKSREAVETNEKIERLLLAVHSVFNSLMERKKDFDAAAVRDMFQGNADMQMTLLKLLDRHNEEMKARVGVDRAPTTMSTYVYTRRTLAEFIKTEFKVSDLVFGQTAQRAVHP